MPPYAMQRFLTSTSALSDITGRKSIRNVALPYAIQTPRFPYTLSRLRPFYSDVPGQCAKKPLSLQL
jgi:hypothetical protein